MPVTDRLATEKKQQHVRHKLVLCNLMKLHRSYEDILQKVQ
jgi:hypothetical protein